jgi:hypothetical protein
LWSRAPSLSLDLSLPKDHRFDTRYLCVDHDCRSTASALLSHPKTNDRVSLSDVLGGVAAKQMMMADKVSRADVERLIEQTKRHRDKSGVSPS